MFRVTIKVLCTRTVRRKTAIALLLSCIIAFPLLFSGGVQAFQQYVKGTVEERLQSEALVTLSIPASGVQWLEEGRELLINGKMFDIKSYLQKDGYLVATGVYDEGETWIMELLNHFNDKQQNQFIIQLLLIAQSFVVALWIMNKEVPTKTVLQHHCYLLVQKGRSFVRQFFIPPRGASLHLS